jgi:hypothetical protein
MKGDEHSEWARRVSRMIDHRAGDALVRLGDSAGANKLSIRNAQDVEIASVSSTGEVYVSAFLVNNAAGEAVGKIYNDQIGEDRHAVTIESQEQAGEDSYIILRSDAPIGQEAAVVLQAELYGGSHAANISVNTTTDGSSAEINADILNVFAPISISPMGVRPPFQLGDDVQGQRVIGLNADQVDGKDASATPAAGTIPVSDGSGKLDSWVTANPSAANPSATAGKTAINGSASTFMRSDAAPAIGDSDKTDGYHASATPAASTIPVADGGGKLDGWVTANPTGANPSAQVGTAAVNGSAATFMRSDAAPALSQGISPTWTGSHAFSNDITVKGKRLQTQLSETIYIASGALTLTTSFKDVPGLTTGKFTPSVNEIAYVELIVKFLFTGGSAAAQTGDAMLAQVVMNDGSDHVQSPIASVNVSGYFSGADMVAGGEYAIARCVVYLNAGTTYTIRGQAKNNTGGRGQTGTASEICIRRIAA